MSMAAPTSGIDNGNGNGNDNDKDNDNAKTVAISPVPPTIPPKHERTLTHLLVEWRVGARVTANIKGRDYCGKVTGKDTSNYVVEFDVEVIPSKQRAWASTYLTVLLESWKDPPRNFVKDLKGSERLQTRVSYYHGGKQFVGTVKSKPYSSKQ